ncbi:hypothetical protein F511_29193 [Dorcoceras hygrometricum]|uniref:Localized to the inner membrane of the chloroplast n=1 Tax=Dorcoceras hygrometricum TaxID=472368 RepID=A0A2Z7C4K7_9LAMI|nr:hypothetical protein F511_29193 [Dorcoceras hygrometricum]
MTALSNSFVIGKIPALHLSSGASLEPGEQSVASMGATRLTFISERTRISSSQKRAFTIQSGYSDGGRSGGTSLFVGGFVLGGLIVGTLGCVYAPQISKALTGADKKDLMKKLPKFIYDEEKALEKQRKKLSEKIEQLNSAIDNVSNQLRSEEPPIDVAIGADDIEALI